MSTQNGGLEPEPCIKKGGTSNSKIQYYCFLGFKVPVIIPCNFNFTM